MRFEKTQKGNPHELTVRQHVHSAACIERFANDDGFVAVSRRDSSRVFLVRPNDDLFVTKRAWSHGIEHGLFYEIETRFQQAVTQALTTTDEVDHSAITDYAVVWVIRDHLAQADREPIVLTEICGSGLTKDEEEMLETQGAGFVRDGGLMPAHISRWPMAMALFDEKRVRLDWVRWRVGTTPLGTYIICPDAFRSMDVAAIPINPTTALVACHDGGPPDEMTLDLVHRLNRRSLDDARSCVFGHPASLESILSTIIDGDRAGG